MQSPDPEIFTEDNAHLLLNILFPGSDLISITIPVGSFSNFTHVVDARLRDGSPCKIVVRRYEVFGSYDRGEKAHREFKTFELLNQHKVPAPEALYLDEKGEILGIPGIVTRFVQFNLSSFLSPLINLGAVNILTPLFDISPYVSNTIGAVFGFAINWLLSTHIIWRHGHHAADTPAAP